MGSSKIPTVIYYDEVRYAVGAPKTETGSKPNGICSNAKVITVHTAPNLRESAKNERERTTGRVGGFVLAAMAL